MRYEEVEKSNGCEHLCAFSSIRNRWLAGRSAGSELRARRQKIRSQLIARTRSLTQTVVSLAHLSCVP